MNRGLLRAGAINLALLAVLGGIELYLRLTIPASSGESIYQYTLQTRRYKVMKANASITAWGKELRTNNLGFRDHTPVVGPKRPGELRIVVLGDSFTVSAGVNFADIYTSRLQSRLQQSVPGVQIINLAVGGYNPVQYGLVLQEVALSLEPDVLLVGLFPHNDFSNETYEINYRVAKGEQPPEPQLAWYERTYVYRAYLSRLEARLKNLLSGKPAQHAGDDGAGWNDNVAALRTIAQIARQKKLPLVFALLPDTWHFDRQRELFGRVEGMCREHDFACLNLLERFIARRVRESSLRLNALDAHPNERYNAIVAEELAEYFSRVLPENGREARAKLWATSAPGGQQRQ